MLSFLALFTLINLVFATDAGTGASTSMGALCQVKTNATQAQEEEKFGSLCLCFRLCLCLRRGRFHGEISIHMFALLLASLVKTRFYCCCIF